MKEDNYEEQGLSLSDLFFLVKRNLILILIITIFCTAVGSVYGLGIKKTNYTAISTAIVEMPNTTEESVTTSNISGSLYLINSFKTLITLQPVLQKTISELQKNDNQGLYSNLTTTSLGEMVTVTTTTNSLIITISVVTTDPNMSIEIANTLLEQSIDYANTLDNNEPKYETLYHALKEIEKATSTTAKRGASIIIIVSFLIGLVISFVIILIKYLMDDTYTSKEAFEKTFNINILSSIQDAEGGN